VNFLNVGPWELTVILIIAILVVGPKRMVQIVRAIGRTASQMRQLSGEFLGAITSEIQAAEQETRESLESITAGAQETRESLESIAMGAQETIGSIPDEIQATEQETRQALEQADGEQRGATRNIKDDMEAIERETVDIMKEIAQNVDDIVRGEPEADEGRADDGNT
jgi:sec-independent protein translocase protein TatB